METTTHTMTPWRTSNQAIGADRKWSIFADIRDKSVEIGKIYDEDDADHIVRAVNAHDDLFLACQAALDSMINLAAEAGDVTEWNDGGEYRETCQQLRSALTKATT
jgi:hypothetical protein